MGVGGELIVEECKFDGIHRASCRCIGESPAICELFADGGCEVGELNLVVVDGGANAGIIVRYSNLCPCTLPAGFRSRGCECSRRAADHSLAFCTIQKNLDCALVNALIDNLYLGDLGVATVVTTLGAIHTRCNSPCKNGLAFGQVGNIDTEIGAIVKRNITLFCTFGNAYYAPRTFCAIDRRIVGLEGKIILADVARTVAANLSLEVIDIEILCSRYLTFLVAAYECILDSPSNGVFAMQECGCTGIYGMRIVDADLSAIHLPSAYHGADAILRLGAEIACNERNGIFTDSGILTIDLCRLLDANVGGLVVVECNLAPGRTLGGGDCPPEDVAHGVAEVFHSAFCDSGLAFISELCPTLLDGP